MTKKVLSEDNFYFEITEKSLDLANDVIKKMKGNTFHNHYHILYDICESLDDEITYLEIGTYCGASASLVSLSEKVRKIYSVDIGHPMNKEVPIDNVNNFKNDNCVYEYIMGSSMSDEIIKYVTENVKKIDVFYIDGDHSKNAVIKDFENYSNLVTVGGYIIFDDYMDKMYSPEVKHGVDFIVDNLLEDKYEIIGSVSYDLISKTNCPHFISSNEFVLKKIK
jgi:hypothetical protein